MNHSWHTAWQGSDIVVYRDDVEIDRLCADDIERVVFVHRGRGEALGDLVYALVETRLDCLIFPADTGFAGRVNFERQSYWTERACVFWVAQAQARLPARRLFLRWWLRLSRISFNRLPRDEVAASVADWPLVGPQTWEQRKWQRIERNRPFATEKQGAGR